MWSLILTAVFVASVSSSPLANQYIDSVLNTALRNEVSALKMDPAGVPNFVVEFQDKVILIGKVKGKAEFSYGTLTGLSQATRYSECQGPSHSYGAKSINCTIGLNNLKLSYDGKLKYGKMPKMDIKGKANITHTLIFIEVVQNPSMQATLKNFMFTQIGQMTVKFSGMGPLNRFMKVMEDGFKSHVHAEIFNSMSQRFQFALNRAVGAVPMPN